MAQATITTKGQVTIPKLVRESMRLKAGDKIEFILTSKEEVLIRLISRKVDDLFGKLHRPGMRTVSIEEMDAAVREKLKDDFR